MVNFFSPRVKFPVHMIQLAIVLSVLILSVVRMFTRPAAAPRSRAGTMSLGMSAKSLILLLYEILSGHVAFFKKWASLKAYLIINGLEVVFWGAVVFLTLRTNLQWCEGTYCIMAWIIVVLGILMAKLAAYMTIIAYLDFRYWKENGTIRGSNTKYDNSNAVEISSIDGDTSYKGAKRGVSPDDANEILMASHPQTHRQSRSLSRGHMNPEPPRYESFRNDHRNNYGRRHSDAGQQSDAAMQNSAMVNTHNTGAQDNGMSYNAARFTPDPYGGYGNGGYDGQQYYQEHPGYNNNRQGGY